MVISHRSFLNRGIQDFILLSFTQSIRCRLHPWLCQYLLERWSVSWIGLYASPDYLTKVFLLRSKMETIEVLIDLVTIYNIVPLVLKMSIFEWTCYESNHEKAYSQRENVRFYGIEGLLRTLVDVAHLGRVVPRSTYLAKHLLMYFFGVPEVNKCNFTIISYDEIIGFEIKVSKTLSRMKIHQSHQHLFAEVLLSHIRKFSMFRLSSRKYVN